MGFHSRKASVKNFPVDKIADALRWPWRRRLERPFLLAWLGILRNEEWELFCPQCQSRLAQYEQDQEGFPCAKYDQIFPLIGPDGETLVLTEFVQPVQARA